MKRYPKYKYVQLENLAEIPYHWTPVPLKYSAYMKGRIGWQGLKQSEFVDEGPYLITGMDFKNGKLNWDECYHITTERYNEAPEIHVKVDDVLITKDGTIGKLLFIDKLPGKVSLNSHLLLLRPLEHNFSPKYLYYLLHSKYFIRHIDNNKTGTTFYGITQEAMGKFKIFSFDLKEQQGIANFLDHKTRLIDTLIEKKQKQIELLQEQRSAIINQAVTKGLNPNARMKNSGIEWLGEVPEHWTVMKLKFIAHLKSGDFITSGSIEQSGEFPVYGGNGLRGYSSSFTHEGAFILIGRQGALCGNIHLASGCFWASEHAVVTTLKAGYNIEWLAELLRIMNLNQYSVSAAQPGLAVENIQNLHIPVPDFVEQKEIAEFLAKEIGRIKDAIATEENKITLLKEYRTTLISEVVTGKIDVQDEVIP